MQTYSRLLTSCGDDVLLISFKMVVNRGLYRSKLCTSLIVRWLDVLFGEMSRTRSYWMHYKPEITAGTPWPQFKKKLGAQAEAFV
jgi:hypothetical protein